MRITDLKFNHFRNLNLSFKPDRGFNVIIGENGKGKSNFLDGLYLISTGKSFKGFKNIDNLDFNDPKEFAKVDLILDANETLKLATIFTKLEDDKFKHSFQINDKPTLRGKFNYQLKTILFTPASLEMVLGSPDIRREELDELLATFDKDYDKLRREYSYVMRSRNKLLYKINKGYATREQLTYWTERLVKLGSEIKIKRLEFLEDIKPDLLKTATQLFPSSNGEKFSLKYISTLTNDISKLEIEYLQKSEEKFSKEVILGRTLYGPHRDDLEFSIAGRNLHSYGSRGEQRLATMVFKMSAFDYLSRLYETKIVFLLDDIFSELDSSNKKYLLKYVESKDAQVFITTANKRELPKKLLDEAKVLEL